MKTFQTMDCVFNEIILCNWVWHWDVKAMQKFRDFFPTPFAKQRFWFPHRNPNWDLEPTHNSPPLLCCPVLSWWAEDSTGKWPNMAWNSEPWTRGRIMEIQSVWNWKQVEPPGKVRISNEQPGVINSLKLFSPIMSERERKNIPGKSISGNPGTGWKTNLDFPSCSLKSARWDTNSPRIRSSQFGTCSTTPIYIYTHPPKLLRHI